MRLKQQTLDDEYFLTVESLARRTEGLEVEYKGEEGTVIEGPEDRLRVVLEEIKSIREDKWDEMTEGVSNSRATELDDKRIDLRNARNRLREALSNPEHRWREN